MLDWLRRRASAPPTAPAPERKFMAWRSLASPYWPSRDPGAFAREGFARNAVAYRCVRLIAEAAASAPIRVAPEAHPLALLLNRPNPEQTGVELMESFFGHLQVTGNAYLEASAFDDAPPRELYVLRPDRMRVVPGPNGWPIAWEHRAGDSVRRFDRDPLSERAPILHLKLFHPADDWYGLSPMEAAAYAIDIHNAGGAWNKALIDNAARPSGALVYSGVGGAERLSEEQFQRIKTELEEAHTGASNAGRPLLLEGGLDWKPMSLTPADMDFIEARHAAAREIALAFGVPPMLLGIPGDNTYSNYREANLAFWRQTALPLAHKAARAIEIWLGDRWRERASLRVDLEAVPALAAERDALWARVANADFLSEGEKRILAGVDAPPAS
ncbi:MAG: phage portal protein [Alphaproteobacteria bacterium]|nr:phage portal protein [Alphaproteobacteria bacterium]